jgi:hypothetical protein
MSWSAAFTRPVPKIDADAAIDVLEFSGQDTGPAADQFRTAKLAAHAILANVPGPYVMVRMHGHANGVGWHKQDGWANDDIGIDVSQMTDSDLKYYPETAK